MTQRRTPRNAAGTNETEAQAKRAAFEAIQGHDEEAVRRRFAVLGLTADRLGEDELERAVREEVRRLELESPGSTPLVGLRSAMTTTSPPPAEQTPEPVERPRRPAGCEWCGDARMVRRTADRDAALFGVAVPCPRCVSLDERARWAGVPERFVEALHEEPQRLPGKRAAVEFALAWDCETSVVLASRTKPGDSLWGSGKTYLACLMLRRAVEAGRAGRFMEVSDYLDAIKARFDAGDREEQAEAYMQRTAAEPLLVLDDLRVRTERGEWQREMLRALVDRRYRAGRTTVITTNYTSPAEVAEAMGGAVASRLQEYQWVHVGGVDLRGQR